MRLERNSKELRILVIRPDRLGDVILSTPVFEVIKKHYPQSHLCVLMRKPHFPVIEGLASVNEVLDFDPEGRHSGIKGFFRLVSEIRERGFRIAVTLQSHWKVSAAVFLAGIRYRVGPLSKLHSYIFFNRGIRQRRSHVEMHETDYNLQLLRRLGIRVGTRTVSTRVALTAETRAQAKAWLEERGWQEGTPLIAVHPGMGGSALNWPDTHYLELIRILIKEGKRVLITGGPAEDSLLKRIEADLQASIQIQEPAFPLKERALFFGGESAQTIAQLAGLFSWADLVIAPSTGPLHLAVALDKPVITFYPPIRVQSAIRWGPYLPDHHKATVFVPEVYCGEDFHCRGHLCNYFPCMRSLSVTETREAVNQHLAKGTR